MKLILQNSLKLIIIISLAAGILAGCGRPAQSAAPVKNEPKTYAFVAKDVNNPYMKQVYKGFETACAELGTNSLYKGPDSTDADMQADIINQLVKEKIDGIAVAANDADILRQPLEKAMNSGIPVISLDSAVNKDSRMTHVQQADPEIIGRGLIQSAAEMVNYNGGIAILSSTEQAANQNLWIEWMQKELKENEDKYKQTPLIAIVYGDDELQKSTEETLAILHNPDIKVIISPTVVGMLAAARVISDKGSDVKLTGLGLPSEMSPFIENSICPWMYLWNPVDVGYLSGYTLYALDNKSISGSAGDKFDAGILGPKVIIAAGDGGTEVMLGAPYQFDKTNISKWKDIY